MCICVRAASGTYLVASASLVHRILDCPIRSGWRATITAIGSCLSYVIDQGRVAKVQFIWFLDRPGLNRKQGRFIVLSSVRSISTAEKASITAQTATTAVQIPNTRRNIVMFRVRSANGGEDGLVDVSVGSA